MASIVERDENHRAIENDQRAATLAFQREVFETERRDRQEREERERMDRFTEREHERLQKVGFKKAELKDKQEQREHEYRMAQLAAGIGK